MLAASWPLFVIASPVLIATPGQDMILVMSRSVALGLVFAALTGLYRSSRAVLLLGIKLAFEQQA